MAEIINLQNRVSRRQGGKQAQRMWGPVVKPFPSKILSPATSNTGLGQHDPLGKKNLVLYQGLPRCLCKQILWYQPRDFLLGRIMLYTFNGLSRMSKLIYGWGNHHKNADWVSFYQMIVLFSVEVLVPTGLKSEEHVLTKGGDPACQTHCSDPVGPWLGKMLL